MLPYQQVAQPLNGPVDVLMTPSEIEADEKDYTTDAIAVDKRNRHEFVVLRARYLAGVWWQHSLGESSYNVAWPCLTDTMHLTDPF